MRELALIATVLLTVAGCSSVPAFEGSTLGTTGQQRNVDELVERAAEYGRKLFTREAE